MKTQLSKAGEAKLKNMIRTATALPLQAAKGYLPTATSVIDGHPLITIATIHEGKHIAMFAYSGRWGVGPANDIAYGPGKLSRCEVYIAEYHAADDMAGAYAAFAERLENVPFPSDRIIEGQMKWAEEVATDRIHTIAQDAATSPNLTIL